MKKLFLQQTWKLELGELDIELKAMENKIESLEDENLIELRHEVYHAVQDIYFQVENNELQDREDEQAMAINELMKENKRLQNRVRELSTSAARNHSPLTRGKV